MKGGSAGALMKNVVRIEIGNGDEGWNLELVYRRMSDEEVQEGTK